MNCTNISSRRIRHKSKLQVMNNKCSKCINNLRKGSKQHYDVMYNYQVNAKDVKGKELWLEFIV